MDPHRLPSSCWASTTTFWRGRLHPTSSGSRRFSSVGQNESAWWRGPWACAGLWCNHCLCLWWSGLALGSTTARAMSMLGTIRWKTLFGAALRRLGGPGFWRGMRLAAQGPTLTLLSRLQRYGMNGSDRRAFCWEGRWATGHRRGGSLCFTAGSFLGKDSPGFHTLASFRRAAEQAWMQENWDTDAKTDGLPPLGRNTLCLVELDAQAQASTREALRLATAAAVAASCSGVALRLDASAGWTLRLGDTWSSSAKLPLGKAGEHWKLKSGCSASGCPCRRFGKRSHLSLTEAW